MKGRKPKPPELKSLSGAKKSGWARPLSPPDIEPTAPPPPPGLPPAAAAEWNWIVPRLDRNRILEPANQTALAMLCRAKADFDQAVAALAKKGGWVTSTARGGARMSPWVKIMESARDAYLKIAVEFGLTPSARARLHVPKKNDEKAARKARFLK